MQFEIKSNDDSDQTLSSFFFKPMQNKDKAIHMITLNIPDPPDYGGMIDSYYRIKTLHSLGVKIFLHCFVYDRKPSIVLESLCEKVYYYARHKSLGAMFSLKPYIVSGRHSKLLLNHLLQDNLPVFFDGLHTTYHISNPRLKDRMKAVRVHNIEHIYYKTLAKLEPNRLNKIFFLIEAIKLQYYEKVLFRANYSFTVSPREQQYFLAKYKNGMYVPSFHPYSSVESLPGSGTFILFHGDLSVVENVTSCMWLIREVFSQTKYTCIIVGKQPPDYLIKLANRYAHITIVANPTQGQMDHYIREAHIHILIALKNNGLKLKLLIALFAGRFCLVNTTIVEETILDALCCVADSATEFLTNIDRLMNQPFTQKQINEREALLNTEYNNRSNALKMMEVLFN